jgi:hypothetical protein
MESDMTPQAAARELYFRLRDQPWFTTVGVGEKDGAPVLYVYVKPIRGIDLPESFDSWEGFTVEVKKMGTPRPAER